MRLNTELLRQTRALVADPANPVDLNDWPFCIAGYTCLAGGCVIRSRAFLTTAAGLLGLSWSDSLFDPGYGEDHRAEALQRIDLRLAAAAAAETQPQPEPELVCV